MKHQYETSAECGCDNPGCIVCFGGLAYCRVCKLFEGCLTTECPGVPSYRQYGEDVYAGRIDFRNGEWVKGVTAHMAHLFKGPQP